MKVKLVNPHAKQPLPGDEVARRQAQAVQSTRDVVGDPALAGEIESLSVEDYAARKGFQLVNPTAKGKVKKTMTTQTARTDTHPELGAELDKLSEAIEQLRTRYSARRANPTVGQAEDIGAKLDRCSAALEAARRGRKRNPGESSEELPSARAERRVMKLRAERDEILDLLVEAQDFLDEGEPEDAQEILDEILDRFEFDD